MGTKEQLLRLLEENRERYVSGAAMAQAIGVSRNAVWKAVEALRAEGYAIDAVTNKGYALSQENDLLSPQGIERFLPPGHPFAISVRKRVDSTNSEARRRAAEGAPEGTVIVAEGYPTVLKAVQDLGYKTLVVDTSEYRKIDGGLSCLSLRF